MSIRDARDADSRVQDDHLSTGIEVLDEDLIRGIPKGSTIAIIGNPQSMAYLIPAYLCLTGRDTQYVSTLKPSEHVEETLASLDELDDGVPDNVDVVDTLSGTESAEESIQKYTSRIGENDNFVLDTATSISDSDEFEKLIRTIQTETRRNNGLTYLYFAAPDIDSLTRDELEVLHTLDGVFNIELGLTGDSIEHRLVGSDIPDEIVKLNVGTRLSVDTTRDIA